MPVLLETRPPGLNANFRPGNTFTLTLNWPVGSLTGRLFTAALGAAPLSVNVAGDVMTMTASVAVTTAAAQAATFVLAETTGGASQAVIIGTWYGSSQAATSQTATVTVNESAGTVTIAAVAASTIDTNARLETVGAAVPQTLSTNYRDLWLAYIRDAGTAGGTANRRFLGGDMLDAFQIATGPNQYMWVGADWWAGGEPSVHTSDDTFISALLPFRNGDVTENPAGTLTNQIFTGGGAGGEWMDADGEGGEAAGSFWWFTSGVRLPPYGGGQPIIAVGHLMGSDNPGDPTLGAVNTSIVSTNAFALYGSHINTGWGPAANFWLHKVRHDPDDSLVYGMGLVVNYNAVAPAAGDFAAWKAVTPGEYKIARVAQASITTLSAWEFWNGTTWVANDPGAAVPVADVSGETRLSMTGNPVKIRAGHWVNVGRTHVLDPHLDVYRAEEPQGPWEKTARVPVPAASSGLWGPTRLGGMFQPGLRQVSHHATILPHLASIAPAGHQVAMLTYTTVGDPLALVWDDLPIGVYCPQFVVVPEH